MDTSNSNIQAALKLVNNKDKFIVLVGKRVKQLMNGARPLVPVVNSEDFIATAIKEVLAEKIWYHDTIKA